MSSASAYFVSQSVAAEVLGVDARTLRRWKTAPRRTDGRYDLRELVAWRIREVEIELLGTGQDTESRSEGLERLRKARAELAELDLQERRGELVAVAAVASDVRAGVGLLRDTLLGLAPTLPPQLVGRSEAEIAGVLDTVLRSALGDLSARFKAMTGEAAA